MLLSQNHCCNKCLIKNKTGGYYTDNKLDFRFYLFVENLYNQFRLCKSASAFAQCTKAAMGISPIHEI